MIQLDELQPIILPPPVSLWPLAPGWWLLAAVLAVCLTTWLFIKKARTAVAPAPQSDPLREHAVEQLHALAKPYDGEHAGAWLQQLNQLLKRLCAIRYPDSASHTLSGREWLAFLDSRCPAAGLTHWMILVQGAYQPDCRLDDKSIAQLQSAVEIWIRKHV